MTKQFLTIAKAGTHEIEIKKSKFITHVQRVNNETEAKAFVAKINELHKKATHNCFAYVIGKNDEIQRETDNGEPSGTAGVPILEVIKNNQIHDTAVVVTRYFGGIKLGAGGLIRAYSNSASQAIESIGIVEKLLQTQIDLTIEYRLNDKLQYFLNEHQFNILATDYGAQVTIKTAVLSSEVENFKNEVTNLLAGNVEIKTGEESYFEVPYHKNKE